MQDAVGKDYFQFYTRQYAVAVRAGNHEEALVCAAKGYLAAVELGDETGRTAFLHLFDSPIHTLVGEPARLLAGEMRQGLRCSFCGREKSQVEIVLGAHGAICRICAANVQNHFTRKPRARKLGFKGRRAKK
jgi:hypothetical protein